MAESCVYARRPVRELRKLDYVDGSEFDTPLA